jgi:fibronectin type III domain protein
MKFLNTKTILAAIALTLFSAMILAGCQGASGGGDAAATRISLSWPAEKSDVSAKYATRGTVPETVDRITIQVTGPDISTIQASVDLETGQVTLDVPDGSNRVFQAWAYPVNSTTPSYYGTTTVNISGDTTVVIQMSTDVPEGSGPASLVSIPSGIAASPDNIRVDVSWETATNATTYNLYWDTEEGVDTTDNVVSDLADTTYAHTGLVNGTTYFYVVTAVNDDGESDVSDEVSATPDGAWQTAEVIDNADDDASGPRVAFDDSGNAVAVWFAYDSTTGNPGVWSGRFTPADGWGTPEAFDNGTSEAIEPNIAVDPAGNAVAVWAIFNPTGSTWEVWANRYTAGGAWGSPERISDSSTVELSNIFYGPVPVGIDDNGNAIAVWVRYDHFGGTYQVVSNRYVAGTGWEGPTSPVLADDTGAAFNIDLSVAPDGNAVVVWVRDDLVGSFEVISTVYAVGAEWGEPEIIQTASGTAGEVKIAGDASGNAVAAWAQQVDSNYEIAANRYAAGTGWDSTEVVSTDSNPTFYLDIASDPDGNAILIWSREVLPGSNDMVSLRYTEGTGWGTTVDTVESGISSEMVYIAADPYGNALATYHRDDGSGIKDAIAARYVSDTGWETPEVIDSASGTAAPPHIAIDSDGNAIAVWAQDDGTEIYDIWANRYAFP